MPDIENSLVVEVGPGPGGLTRALLLAGAKRVIAIEKDIETQPILTKIQEAAHDRLDVIYGDALKVFQSSDFIKQYSEIQICANLPYNVGTGLLIDWLHLIVTDKLKIKSMTLMFQREVAQRITAKVGDEHYGRLAVLTDLIADAKILFNVPNTAFTPMPKVQSAIVQIIPNRDKISKIGDISKLEKLTERLFGQRRKMVRSIAPEINWPDFGLAGTERGEVLNPNKFLEISQKL